MSYDGDINRGPISPSDKRFYDYLSSSSAPYPPDGEPRSRASSAGRPQKGREGVARDREDSQRPRPLFEGVNDAFDKVNSNAFDTASASSQVSRDVIEQITAEVRAQVMESLKTNGIPGIQPNNTGQSIGSRSPTASTTNSYPSRPVYTPPSPHRHDDSDSDGSQSPVSEPTSKPSGKEDLKDRYGDRSDDMKKSNPNVARSASRPPAHDDGEETTLEKIWQPLFDADCKPTPRVNQFLRGLALHLIEDYEPKKNLVVTPAKMKRFYEDARLSDETYPWNTIFGGKLSNSAISRIYRDLRCQHHLVQETPADEPRIPALTPEGFASWMTIMVQAHPDAEFERLTKAVLDMPISNADDRKERYPKELSRRLFPKTESLPARQRCAIALSAEGQVTLPKPVNIPPPPSSQPPSGFGERERAPYGGRPEPGTRPPPPNSTSTRDSQAIVDDDFNPLERTTSKPIERERKPYTAKEGAGKRHEGTPLERTTSSATSNTLKPESTLPNRDHRNSTASSASYKSDHTVLPSRDHRSSTVSQQAPYVTAPTTPFQPEFTPHHHHRNSVAGVPYAPGRADTIPDMRRPSEYAPPPPGHHHYRTSTNTSTASAAGAAGNMRRPRSPSFSQPYTRSDGQVGDIPASYFTSNAYSDDDERADRSDRSERATDRSDRSERDRDRDREAARERDREREREKDRERERERDREREREREKERERSDKYRDGDRYEPASSRYTPRYEDDYTRRAAGPSGGEGYGSYSDRYAPPSNGETRRYA
ncbi:hypothetical protein K402DRAFT_400218 [Aulographum hederae CBS 113979]|uniref:DUF7514 domain-containing protein n=1 Tax=Aulographum hederae CBS 113979 TaxID=1176131 RepID=A0A6G1HEN3_9PEZI|nr:hypothetical protein K402DRAFT_400218 [Aulographum hederae CBS 113979]